MAARSAPLAPTNGPVVSSPALLTSTSMGPRSASTRSINPSTAAGSARSAGNAAPSIESATASSGPRLRATRDTRAPAVAIARAMDSPIPRVAPVTST